MRPDRPIATLNEAFPPELQTWNVKKTMKEPLELRVNDKQRIVLSRLESDVLLEVEVPTNLRSGHGWGLVAQVRLEAKQVDALRCYLEERQSKKVQ